MFWTSQFLDIIFLFILVLSKENFLHIHNNKFAEVVIFYFFFKNISLFPVIKKEKYSVMLFIFLKIIYFGILSVYMLQKSESNFMFFLKRTNIEKYFFYIYLITILFNVLAIYKYKPNEIKGLKTAILILYQIVLWGVMTFVTIFLVGEL